MFPLLLALSSPASAVTLEEVWAAADANGLEAQLIHEQRVQSDTLQTQALSLLSPKLVLGADYTINQREVALDFSESIPEEFAAFFEGSEPIVVNKKQYLSWNASVVQPLFSGQALPLYRGARDLVKAGAATEDGMRAQLRVGVAQVWWGLRVAREGEKVAADALENARKHLEMASTTVAVGSAAPVVKLQAELGVARAERQLSVARENVVIAQEAFARLTGLPADSVPTPGGARVLPYADLDAAVSRAVSARHDIRAAELQAHAARMQAAAGNLAWLPTVDGRFTQAYTENSGFSGEPYNWQLVFTANWVLWDGGARVAEQVKSASMKRAAEVQVESLRQQATEQVRTLWHQHARAEVAVAAVQKELGMAEENLRLAEAAFAAGTLSYLEVEDARLGVRATRMTALVEEMNRDVAAIQLLQATGDL